MKSCNPWRGMSLALCATIVVVLHQVAASPPASLMGSLVRAWHGCRAQANCPSVLPASVTQPVIALRNAAVVRRQLVSPASVNTTTACQSQYSNPLIDSDFPDPSEPIVGQDGRLYVYATNSLGFNIQYATASAGDLTTWTYENADALPDSGFPSWASSDDGYTWAPGVMQINGVFVMYYTVRSIADKTQCISRATSPLAAGPFHDSSSAPLICQIALGGSIDPQPFQDSDGQLYLAWKNDGNSIGKGTAIFLQRLSADGAALLGSATQLLQADSPWEVGIIEAPSIQLCEGGQYCLFYSGGPYAGDQYAVGVAVAPSVRGPYTKYAGNPVLATTGAVIGPGGASLFTSGSLYSVYHTWNDESYLYRPLSLVGVTDSLPQTTAFFASPTYGVPTCE